MPTKQSPHPEHAIRGEMLRSVYNNNVTIRTEYLLPGGSGDFGNSIFGSSNGSLGSGAIIGGGVFSDRPNRFEAAFSAGGGSSSALFPSAADGGLGTGCAAFFATGQSISSVDRTLSRTSRSLSPLGFRGGGAGGQVSYYRLGRAEVCVRGGGGGRGSARFRRELLCVRVRNTFADGDLF